MTDKELERIYNEGYRAVYWTAMQLLKNEADAEDVVQDTFVALIESYDTIKDKDKVIPWLKKIAANKCLNRLTRTKTDSVEDEFFEEVEALPEDFLPDSIVESEEARRIIMDIIDNSLSEDIRRTLILFYFDEMSTRDIAEALGVPEGTVRRRLNFARNKIKKEVEKYEEENKTKLFSMALPFLSKLFMKEAEQVPFKPMPAKIASLSASAQVSHAGAATKAAASAAKKGTEIMINKVIIAAIASVVVTGGVIGGIIAFNSRGAADDHNRETSVISEASGTAEEGTGTSAVTDTETSDADVTEAGSTDLSSRTMRDLTDDDLFICLGGGTVYMNGSIHARVVNGTVRVGDEVRLVGHAFETFSDYFGGVDHITATVSEMGSYPAGEREPLQEASAGDEICIKFDGIDSNNSSYIGMSVVREGSDLAAEAIGVKTTVTLADGAVWPGNPGDSVKVYFHAGNFGPDGTSSAAINSCYKATATLMERNGDTLTLLIKFEDYHYLMAPGLDCHVDYDSHQIAGGTIDVVYLDEN